MVEEHFYADKIYLFLSILCHRRRKRESQGALPPLNSKAIDFKMFSHDLIISSLIKTSFTNVHLA